MQLYSACPPSHRLEAPPLLAVLLLELAETLALLLCGCCFMAMLTEPLVLGPGDELLYIESVCMCVWGNKSILSN